MTPARDDLETYIAERTVCDPELPARIEAAVRQRRLVTGNPVEILDVANSDAPRLLRSRRPLWSDIRQQGLVVHGRTLEQLARQRSAEPKLGACVMLGRPGAQWRIRRIRSDVYFCDAEDADLS